MHSPACSCLPITRPRPVGTHDRSEIGPARPLRATALIYTDSPNPVSPHPPRPEATKFHSGVSKKKKNQIPQRLGMSSTVRTESPPRRMANHGDLSPPADGGSQQVRASRRFSIYDLCRLIRVPLPLPRVSPREKGKRTYLSASARLIICQTLNIIILF